LVLIISIFVTRIAAIALSHTGLSQETAKFQARSAFTGVGFTPSESEKVVNHPLRRRILLILMIVGNAGIVTGVTSLILGFVNTGDGGRIWLRLVILIGGVVVLWTVASSSWVERRLSHLIDKLLKKATDLNIMDYNSLLHLSGEYRIAEITIEEGHWLKGKRIRDTNLRKEGILVLGVNRKDGTFLGAAQPDTRLNLYDSIVVYGRIPVIARLEKRSRGFSGNMDHLESMDEQEKVVEKERALDSEGSSGAERTEGSDSAGSAS
jgi:K+/H+ antiporter YhaU regulatory subunit KhtT